MPPLATPTSAQTVLTRLLHSQAPLYQHPPATALTPLQAAFLASGFSSLPPPLDPTATPCTTTHDSLRYTRKRMHITAIVRHLLPLLPPHGRLLDACCGTAHVGLVLAYLLPGWTVTLLDRSARALAIASERAEEARLTNVETVLGGIEAHVAPFDALVALHACGGASDACLAGVVARGAVGVVVPCCTGGSVTSRGAVTGVSHDAGIADPHPRGGAVDWRRARSDVFRRMLGASEFSELARAADGVEAMGRVAKTLLEHDRVLWMRECGRECAMGRLGGGVKDDVICVGDVSRWGVDHVGNGVVDDFLGLEDGALAVAQVLRDAVVGRGEEYRAGGGRVARKSVHAAAEMLGLTHCSVGKGKDRVVVVTRGDAGGRVYCHGSIGVRSRAIDELAGRLCRFVPRECVDRRAAVRGDGFHVTLLNPSEVRGLGRVDDVVREAEEVLRGSVVRVLGVGMAQTGGVRGWDGVAGEGLAQREAFYVVLDWSAVQELRKRHGLPRVDVHITLGFRGEDVHGVRKDATTLVETVDETFVL